MTLAFITHPECHQHGLGIAHPENWHRLSAIQDGLVESCLSDRLIHFKAPLADRDQLYAVHSKNYVDSIFESEIHREQLWLDPDTFMTSGSLAAARRAAGANLLAVDLLMTEKATQVFCNVRPPGHHAERNHAMGFCLFNNVAVGAAYAKTNYNLKRIAIIDFDVHHGNGTEDIFQDDSNILFCSLFQHPFYPFKGNINISNNIINIPVAAGTNGQEYRDIFASKCIPVIEEFKPQLILVSAGFDAHAEDTMSELNLVESDYGWLAKNIKSIAKKYCDGRVGFTLEGGYSLKALSRSVVAVIKELI